MNHYIRINKTTHSLPVMTIHCTRHAILVVRLSLWVLIRLLSTGFWRCVLQQVDMAISIATCCGLDDRGSYAGEGKRLSSPYPSTPSLGRSQPNVQQVPWLFGGVKPRGRGSFTVIGCRSCTASKPTTLLHNTVFNYAVCFTRIIGRYTNHYAIEVRGIS